MLEMKKKELDEMALAKKKMVSRDDFQRLLGMLNRARKSRLRYERLYSECQAQVKALKSRKGSGGASFAATVEVGEGDPVDRLMSTRRRNIDNTIRSYQEIVQNSEIEKKKLKATKVAVESLRVLKIETGTVRRVEAERHAIAMREKQYLLWSPQISFQESRSVVKGPVLLMLMFHQLYKLTSPQSNAHRTINLVSQMMTNSHWLRTRGASEQTRMQ